MAGYHGFYFTMSFFEVFNCDMNAFIRHFFRFLRIVRHLMFRSGDADDGADTDKGNLVFFRILINSRRRAVFLHDKGIYGTGSQERFNCQPVSHQSYKNLIHFKSLEQFLSCFNGSHDVDSFCTALLCQILKFLCFRFHKGSSSDPGLMAVKCNVYIIRVHNTHIHINFVRLRSSK